MLGLTNKRPGYADAFGVQVRYIIINLDNI
jgi:hypothetical protein